MVPSLQQFALRALQNHLSQKIETLTRYNQTVDLKNASLEQKLHELTLQYDTISAVLQQKEKTLRLTHDQLRTRDEIIQEHEQTIENLQLRLLQEEQNKQVLFPKSYQHYFWKSIPAFCVVFLFYQKHYFR